MRGLFEEGREITCAVCKVEGRVWKICKIWISGYSECAVQMHTSSRSGRYSQRDLLSDKNRGCNRQRSTSTSDDGASFRTPWLVGLEWALRWERGTSMMSPVQALSAGYARFLGLS